MPKQHKMETCSDLATLLENVLPSIIQGDPSASSLNRMTLMIYAQAGMTLSDQQNRAVPRNHDFAAPKGLRARPLGKAPLFAENASFHLAPPNLSAVSR